MTAISMQGLNTYRAIVLQNLPKHDRLNRQISTWFNDFLFNQNMPEERIEQEAASLLGRIQATADGQRRYKFITSSKDQLIKVVFEKSFRNAPDALIQKGESIDPAHGTFYPRWKKICWIKVPRAIADFLGSPAMARVIQEIVQTVFIVFLFLSLFYLGGTCYGLTEALGSKAAAFIASHTSINIMPLIHLIIAIEAIVLEVVARIILLVGCLMTVAQMSGGRGAEIARNLRQFRICDIGERAFTSLFSSILTASTTCVEGLSAIAAALKEMALREQQVQTAICRKKAYAVWVRAIRERTP